LRRSLSVVSLIPAPQNSAYPAENAAQSMKRGAQADPLGNSMAETIVHCEQAESDYSGK
jgi:hypothetical protein